MWLIRGTIPVEAIGEMAGVSSRDPSGASPTPVLDEHFSDPSAQIRLQAGDILFRVHEWNLHKHCGFFRDMSNICDGDISSAPIIQSDVTPQVLRVFLIAIHCGLAVILSITTPFDYDILLPCRRLADKWDCDSVGTYCRSQIDTLIRVAPWRGFQSASKENDVELAQRCLKAFTNTTVDRSLYNWNRHSLCLSHFDGVQETFFAELHRAVQEDLARRGATRPDWTRVADDFSPRLEDSPRKRPREES